MVRRKHPQISSTVQESMGLARLVGPPTPCYKDAVHKQSKNTSYP